MSATATRADALPRSLGLWSAVTIVAGITIGSGIFRSPAGIANRLPGPGAMCVVWVVGGILAMCGALALAEVASTYPKTGGIDVFRGRPGYAPAFRCPGYPVVPILCILATLYLLVNAVVDETTRWPTMAVFGVILVGIPVYYATIGRRLAPPDGARTAAGETA